MPRIREYSGYGNQSADQDADARRERIYRLPEVLSELKEEATKETEDVVEVSLEPSEDVVEDLPQQESKNEIKNKENQSMQEEKPTIGKPIALEKIVIQQVDVSPKYTSVDAAIESIVDEGVFYEDYLRTEQTELLKSKEFVLSVISQCYERYYAPQTPKSADWIDELYLAERSSFLFEQTREGINEDAAKEFGIDLYVFLRKFAFSEDAFKLIDREVRRTMKIASSQVRSSEDAVRMRSSLSNFQAAVSSALAQVNEKHLCVQNAKAARKEKLVQDKQELKSMIDDMKF